MSHWALIDGNNVVQFVTPIDDQFLPDQTDRSGTDFLNAAGVAGTGNVWKRCSYNTHGGVHDSGGTPYRCNYPGTGWLYNPTIDGFCPPQPYPSWTLNTTTGLYDPPTPMPTDGKTYTWDETTLSWVVV